MGLTIKRIDTIPFRLPMEGELKWGSHGHLDSVRHVLIQVVLSDGSVGVAEAPPRPTIYGETVESIVAIVHRELAPRLVGQDATGAWALMQPIRNNHTAKGALDMAVHDAVACSQGISLAEKLGCTHAHLRVSYILGIGDRDTVLAEAERVVKRGVRVLKVKVGRDWQEDIGRIRDLQAMFGATVDLYADANETMLTSDAAAKLETLRALGILYCEEPLPVELIRERAALRAGNYLPLIADDSAMDRRELARELAMDTFDILNIKPPRTGFTESLAMIEQAQRAGKGIMVGSQAGTGIGTARAALVAAQPGVDHPSELSFFLKLKEDIVDRPLPLDDGYLHLADALAVRVDPTRLREAAE